MTISNMDMTTLLHTTAIGIRDIKSKEILSPLSYGLQFSVMCA
jgi:hypothetical protein